MTRRNKRARAADASFESSDARKRREQKELEVAENAFADWATWQLLDPLLPTGGFAHSQGLESAAHSGLVKGGDDRLARRGETEFGWDAETFARECVASAASQSVPFVEAARRVFFSLRELELKKTDGGTTEAKKTTPEDHSVTRAYAYSVAEATEAFVALDRRLAARLVGNAVTARASAATGAALLRAALVAFGKPKERNDSDSSSSVDDSHDSSYDSSYDSSSFFSAGLTEALARAKGSTRSEKERGTRLPGAHLAVAFGAIAGAAGFSARHAARMFCYLTLRDTLSAATRLNLLGPLAAGAAMRRCAANANACAVEAVDACVRAAEREEASVAVFLSERHAAQRERAVLLAMTSRAASSAPLVDIVHAGHDALFSRLFNS